MWLLFVSWLMLFFNEYSTWRVIPEYVANLFHHIIDAHLFDVMDGQSIRAGCFASSMSFQIMICQEYVFFADDYIKELGELLSS